MCALYERVVDIISKSPELREEREVIELLPWFQKKSEVFRSLEKDVVLDLIRNCQFLAVQRDNVVIRQGEKGDSFYIILRGQVSVHVNTDISDKDEDKPTEELAPLKFTELGILDRKQFGQELNTLEGGKAFGELALINDNCIRNASIVADELTDLLVVNRELFNRSLCAAQAADFAARTRFSREHPMFRGWATKHRRQLAMSVRREKRGFDQNVVKQGDKANAVYFLVKGQGKVTVDPNLHRLQFPQFLLNEGQGQRSSDQSSIYEDRTMRMERSKTDYNAWTSSSSSSFADQRRRSSQKRRVEISVVAVNEILGDVEFVLELKSYIYSVTCLQDCELYSLNAQNYDRLVARRNPKTVELLRNNAHLKLLSRLSRFQPDELPLLRTILWKLEGKSKQGAAKKQEQMAFFLRPEVRSRNTSPRQILFPRGAMIDKYGPGTVFYRNRAREEKKLRRERMHGSAKQQGVVAKGCFLGSSTARLNKEDSLVSGRERSSPSGVDGVPSCPDPDFADEETSEEALAALEERIRGWHTAVTAAGRANNDCTRLHRLYIDQNIGLVPGTKVVFRKRQEPDTELLDPFGSMSFQSPRRESSRILGSARECTHSSFADSLGTGSVPFSSRSVKSFAQTPTENKKENGRKSYTADEYKMLKKKLLQCQRQMIKYGIFY